MRRSFVGAMPLGITPSPRPGLAEFSWQADRGPFRNRFSAVSERHEGVNRMNLDPVGRDTLLPMDAIDKSHSCESR